MKTNHFDRSIKLLVVVFALVSVFLVIGMPFLKHFEEKPSPPSHTLNSMQIAPKTHLAQNGSFQP